MAGDCLPLWFALMKMVFHCIGLLKDAEAGFCPSLLRHRATQVLCSSKGSCSSSISDIPTNKTSSGFNK